MSNLVKKSSAENLKSSPERPTDKPINNNIKERLNLHVKRRLQESASDTTTLNNNNNNTNNNNNNNEVKVRKPYTKRTDKANATTINRRTKRTKLKTSSGSGAVSRKDAEAIGAVASASTATSAGDDEGSRDGNSQSADLLHSPKEKEKCPDLLGLVLNVKKRALFRSPEVVKFLQSMMDALKN